jgi:hypothetical protein
MRLIAAPIIMGIAPGVTSIDTEILVGGQPLGLQPRINPGKQPSRAISASKPRFSENVEVSNAGSSRREKDKQRIGDSTRACKKRMRGRTGWAVIWRSEGGPAPGEGLRASSVVGGAHGEFLRGGVRTCTRVSLCESRCGDRQERRGSAYQLTRSLCKLPLQ